MSRLVHIPLQVFKEAEALRRRLATNHLQPRAEAVPLVVPPKKPAPLKKAGPPSAAPRNSSGKYDEALVETIEGQPGISVAQAAAAIGVHPTALYPVVRRLEARGRVLKRGRSLHTSGGKLDPGWERLWCEAGHPWERRTVRGRKPGLCPQHR